MLLSLPASVKAVIRNGGHGSAAILFSFTASSKHNCVCRPFERVASLSSGAGDDLSGSAPPKSSFLTQFSKSQLDLKQPFASRKLGLLNAMS